MTSDIYPSITPACNLRCPYCIYSAHSTMCNRGRPAMCWPAQEGSTWKYI